MTKILTATDSYLIQKYNTEAFMYVEYPHKRYWEKNIKSDKDYRSALIAQYSNNHDQGAMLYVHMPYCQSQCWFCTCHVEITKSYDDVKEYMDLLFREFDMLAEFLKENNLKPTIDEIHLGGGSPTFIKEPEFDLLVEKLKSIADFSKLKEFSIEIDPRRVKHDRMRYYHSKGITRVSFGVQDFDPDVQKAVNRLQPAELTERLLIPEIRELFPNGINFDLICGLPHQSVDSISRTIDEVVKLSPDRICLNYLHIAPTFHKHQLLMPQDALPDVYKKKDLFTTALEKLTASGYIRTGYDHFAKPSDDVAKALENGEMGWNRLGVTAGRYMDIIGLGVSSVGTIGKHYYMQNTFSRAEYKESLDAGRFPVATAHKLSDDDVLRRDVIQMLRSYFQLPFSKIEQKYNISFKDYFQNELQRLDGFITDGILEVNDEGIQITEVGQQFANLVCSNFDSYLSSQRQ